MKMPRKEKKTVKPNLIPILDAVFIFIFFLLMSAQFLDIYEIGSDAPAVKTITEEKKNDRPPLNLTLDISKAEIIVKTGLDEKIIKTIKRESSGYNLESLNETLASLKIKNPKETSVILRPKSNVPYNDLVRIMDNCRTLREGTRAIAAENEKGLVKEERKLFEQIIFETII